MEKKKTTIITISATLALILLVATATYAYFEADLGNNKEVDVTVSTVPQTDLLSFAVGDPLALQADETSFVKGGDSASDTTNVKALLTAGAGTSTKYYYVYLFISSNEFIYTQDENTPELILTVTSPDGTELTSIDGLTYKTVTDGKGTTIKGFDITTKKGLITIANNKKITTTSTIEEQWDVTVTLVNYDVNQINNIRKNFTSKLLISQEEFVYSPATVCSAGKTLLSSCIVLLNDSIDTLYYHDGSLKNGINDNSYRYAGGSNSVNNYICLGSDATTCPEDNLFRIIGVFGDQIKVIKVKSIGNLAWDENNSNTWSTSSLNTYLNGTYLTSLGTLAEKIATTTWKVGGNTYAKIRDTVPATAYQNEVVNPVTTNTTDNATEYSAKIGLIYVSDYYYSANPDAWNFAGVLNDIDSSTKDYRNAKSWMKNLKGYDMWTITRNSDETTNAYAANTSRFQNNRFIYGQLFNYAVNKVNPVFPVFSLLNSVTYSSGSGTSSDPIRIN